MISLTALKMILHTTNIILLKDSKTTMITKTSSIKSKVTNNIPTRKTGVDSITKIILKMIRVMLTFHSTIRTIKRKNMATKCTITNPTTLTTPMLIS